MTTVKICGIKTLEAARTATEAGADLLGFVFYPPSPRYIGDLRFTPHKGVQAIYDLRLLQPLLPKMVGLFVNTSVAEIATTAEEYGLDFLQLHGDETPEICREAAKIRPVIKALRLPAQIGLDEALRQADLFGALDNVTLLLDTQKKDLYGGTGETGDWTVARELARRYKLLLAGGLNPENVAEAIELVQPWGVDVSSGVEYSDHPGEKDLDKIRRFLANAKP